MIYLDGNSLGALPRATPARLHAVATEEWGTHLIGSWNTAGWIEQPRLTGDKVGRLIGAGPGEVVAADSTSINLYKILGAAIQLSRSRHPQRRVIVSERDNFPTDLYIAATLAGQYGCELRLVDTDDLDEQLNDDLAILLLTHVNYRTGRMHDMTSICAGAHAVQALAVWDLAHSAGAVPISVYGDGSPATAADFAVGCGYKFLNGGPGAPAFLWALPRHIEQMDADNIWQPLAGWLGHDAPFEFSPEYRPARGVRRFLSGTPSPLALAALDCGVDTVLAADPLGGIDALRAKSLELSDLFIALVESRCAAHHLQLKTPRAHARRGSQVSFYVDEGGYAIMQALIARGVVGDYRDPGILRFGLTPLYLRFADVWDAVDHLVQVLERDEWRQPKFNRRLTVT